MATKFSDIYERAVFKFKDYSFIKTDAEVKATVLKNYLMSALADFKDHCVNFDLDDYDYSNEEFGVDLSNEVVEILATGIAFHWLNAETMNQKLMKNRIFKTDYSTYSPANLLNAMVSLRNEYESEYRSKMHEYSFKNSNVEKLKA